MQKTQTSSSVSGGTTPTSGKAPVRKSSFASFAFVRKASNLPGPLSTSSPHEEDSPPPALPLLRTKGSKVWGKTTLSHSQSDLSRELDRTIGEELSIGKNAFDAYTQWRAEKDADVKDWKEKQQQAQKKLADELRASVPGLPVQGKGMELLDSLGEKAFLEGGGIVEKLSPESGELLRKIGFLGKEAEPLIAAAMQSEEESQKKGMDEALRKGVKASYVVKEGARVGSIDAKLRSSLLDMGIDDLVELHKEWHGVLPDLRQMPFTVASLLKKTRNDATNEDWMASLPSDLKQAARTHLERKKSQIPKGVAHQIAQAHLDTQVDKLLNVLNSMLDTENPHDKETWQQFDKKIQEEIPILVANAITLPILLDRLEGFNQRQAEMEQRKAELDASLQKFDSKDPAYRHLPLVKEVAEPLLENLREEDQSQGATGVIYAKHVDKDAKERALVEGLTKWWQNGGKQTELRQCVRHAKSSAITYVGLMNVELREKLLEEKIRSYARHIGNIELSLGLTPTIQSVEAGIKTEYRNATKEATFPLIHEITKELIGQSEKLVKDAIQSQKERHTAKTNGRSYSNQEYIYSRTTAKHLQQKVSDAIKEIVQGLEKRGIPFNEVNTLREFNEQFGEKRKGLIESAISVSLKNKWTKADFCRMTTMRIAQENNIPEAVAMPVVATKMFVAEPLQRGYHKMVSGNQKFAEEHKVGPAKAASMQVGKVLKRSLPKLITGTAKGAAGAVGAVRTAVGFGEDRMQKELLKLTKDLSPEDRDLVLSVFGRAPDQGNARR